jgi:hypothetical protein
MKPRILEEHKDELVVIINGRVKTIPNNPYTKLRKMYMNDNRILYTFAPFVKANETYNDRIFNLEYDKYALQTRQDLANQIADSILDHYKTGDYTKFKNIFLSLYSTEHKDELVEKFIISLSPLVKLVKKDFVIIENSNREAKLPVYTIDNKFAIDSKGVSWFKRENDNKWQFLCTVVTSQNQTYRVPMGNLGWVQLLPEDSSIISKIVFFLNAGSPPNNKDTVFTGQLKEHSPLLYMSIIDGTYLKQKT